MGKRKIDDSSSEQSGPSKKKSKKPMKMIEEDDDWDSDDEVMLNMDDIFGGDDEDGDSEDGRYIPRKARNVVEPVKINRHLATFHESIGMSEKDVLDVKEKKIKKLEKPQTKAASVNAARNYPPPEIIIFQDPMKKNFKPVSEKLKETKPKEKEEVGVEIDLKKARHEVLRFGMHSLASADKESAELELLVKLGAKAPKKKGINYKDLMAQKRKDKEELARMRASNLLSDQGKLQAEKSLASFKKRLANSRRDKGPIEGRMPRIKQKDSRSKDSSNKGKPRNKRSF